MLGTSLHAKAFRPLIVRAIIFPIAVVVILVAVLIWQVTRLMDNMSWVEHTDNVIAGAHALEKNHIDLEAGLRGFLLTGDASFLAPYDRASQAIGPAYDAAVTLVKDNPPQVERFRAARALHAQWQQYADARLVAARAGRRAFTTDELAVGRDRMEAIRAAFRTIISSEETLRVERSAAARRSAFVTIFAACASALVVGGILALFSRRQLDMLSRAYEQALDKVRDFNATLEKRIDDRTEELRVSNGRLSDANQELEAFSYSISHDLRAPMRHISGFADLLRRGLADRLDADSAENLAVIRQTAKQAGTMVDDLLSFSRMGRTEMKSILVDVRALVGQVKSELASDVAGRDVEWKIGELPPVQADPALLKMVFQNLLSNAIKYTKKREKTVIEIGATTENGRPAYFVRDNGVGFDMRYVDKLFGVFQRLHRAEDFEGTGIGLANVRRIIVRHGGVVRAEGQVESGATFTFTLAAPSSPGSAPATPAST